MCVLLSHTASLTLQPSSVTLILSLPLRTSQAPPPFQASRTLPLSWPAAPSLLRQLHVASAQHQAVRGWLVLAPGGQCLYTDDQSCQSSAIWAVCTTFSVTVSERAHCHQKVTAVGRKQKGHLTHACAAAMAGTGLVAATLDSDAEAVRPLVRSNKVSCKQGAKLL